MEAIELIQKAYVRFHSYGCVINDIRLWLRQHWQVEINHVLHEANQAADFLAKLGAKGQHSWLTLDSPPAEISHLLLVDCMAIVFARV